MKVIDEKDFPAIIRIYNRDGKKAVNKYIRSTYGIKNPWSVMQRIRKTPGYDYDDVRGCFNTSDDQHEERIFMSIDDLCKLKADKPSDESESTVSRPSVSMDDLIRSLISDRLLELSRYVTLEAASRTILIDQTSMISDGYHVVTH